MIALVSALEARDLDTDLPLLRDALSRRGVHASIESWDDDAVRWEHFDLVVLRSAWNYMRRLPDFLGWLEHVDRVSHLVNPIGIVKWSLDKRYLLHLADAGVPIVPSRFIEPGGEPAVVESGDVVVKPAVSAGCNDTARYRPDQRSAAHAHITSLLAAGKVVLVQPYQAQVDAIGETAVVCFGGQASHAFGKGPILTGDVNMVGGVFAEEVITARTATAYELAVADMVLDAVPINRSRLAYARVDLLPGPDGPVVLEVELAEPSVYLHLDHGADDRFAEVLSELSAAIGHG